MLDRINKALRRVPTWTIYILGIFPAIWVVYTALQEVDPIRGIEWGLGLWAVRLLIATLFITPLRWAGLNLLRFRRQLGLVAYAYVVLHFTSWLTIDMGLRWSQIVPDLYKRWYIVVGMSALLLSDPAGPDLEHLVDPPPWRAELEPPAQAGLPRDRPGHAALSHGRQGLHRRGSDLCRDPVRAAGRAPVSQRPAKPGLGLNHGGIIHR